jgi:6-phosphogluconate dehydrogenase
MQQTHATIAMIGLGKMGGNMARRLARGGIAVHAFDASESAREALKNEPGVTVHTSLQDTVSALPSPKIVWVMLPAGEITANTLHALSTTLNPGDLVVDGGNCNYLDSQTRASELHAKGLEFIDCGVSGGVWGLANGYCLMFGGSTLAATLIKPFIKVLAVSPTDGWVHCGAVGSGHFAKMIHNGIEYGMMQAMAEGFALMAGKPDLHFKLDEISEAWRHGSVVRSWLLDLTASALKDPETMQTVAPVVPDSGEGRWTIDEAIRQGTPAPVIAMSVMSRFDSQGKADTTNRLLSLMRKGFGGHAVVESKK